MNLADMKIIRIFSLLLLSTIVGLSGCESDVKDIDSFEGKSKLVVVSYIAPQDTMLIVRVQKTQPAIGRKLTSEQLKVKDAIVTISNGSSTVALNYNHETFQYEADARAWPVEAGKTYSLKVMSGVGNAEAICTIPFTEGIAITELEAPYTIVQDYFGQDVRRYTVSYKWSDAPDKKNYYRTLAYKMYTYTDSYYGTKRVQKEGLYGSFNNDREIQTDEETRNGMMSSEPISYHEYNYAAMDKPFYIYAVLVVSDRNYYLYHRDLNKQQGSNGNPFAEPALIYTNIEGGLGVFAGYNQLVSRLELN
jgi:hypothetical protein